MDTLEHERSKYEQMWARPEYRERSPGMRVAESAYKMMKPSGTMCDFGCGTGRAAAWFAKQGLVVTGFDIAANAMTEHDGQFVQGSLWDMPQFGTFDYGYCTDVMEHLPTEHVEAAISGIADRVKKGVFFQIALFECHMGDVIGEHLHLTVKPAKWWIDLLNTKFTKIHVQPHPKYVLAYCEK